MSHIFLIHNTWLLSEVVLSVWMRNINCCAAEVLIRCQLFRAKIFARVRQWPSRAQLVQLNVSQDHREWVLQTATEDQSFEDHLLVYMRVDLSIVITPRSIVTTETTAPGTDLHAAASPLSVLILFHFIFLPPFNCTDFVVKFYIQFLLFL